MKKIISEIDTLMDFTRVRTWVFWTIVFAISMVLDYYYHMF